MKLRIELLSDTIFGSGNSVPGEEDMSVKCDENGFPYLNGSTFKGILREAAENILDWKGEDRQKLDILFGTKGIEDLGYGVETLERRIKVSDFEIPKNVKDLVLFSVKEPQEITKAVTNLRTFTRIEDGVCKEGSLRTARCIKKGLNFIGEVYCGGSDEEFIKETLEHIKYMGSMRNRGFGHIKVYIEGE